MGYSRREGASKGLKFILQLAKGVFFSLEQSRAVSGPNPAPTRPWKRKPCGKIDRADHESVCGYFLQGLREMYVKSQLVGTTSFSCRSCHPYGLSLGRQRWALA